MIARMRSSIVLVGLVCIAACTKPEAQTALDVVRLTTDQLTCVLAQAELGVTAAPVAAAACGPAMDTVLQDVEKVLLASPKAKAMALKLKRPAAAP
jgi:hypothetical protein